MKLISLYIEKFGGLSQYSLDFHEGLTVIQEPNGFGKTTLAEFIRAMFYGFPRKAKTLDKSRRQKYTPWSGGKFGGNLVFETEGERYRIERTFGSTPRSDTFSLIDLQTGRKSDRFSEEIGVELFQLDGDSFERSTYMPQLHDGGSITTDSIRAKLSDLVEDTNDVGNFDKAVNALKTRRSGFIPYRGSGGSVAEAAAHVSRLQEELDRTEAKNGELTACLEAIGELEAQQRQNEAETAAVRQQITLASEAAAAAAVRRQYESLTAQHVQAQKTLAQLEEKYPKGLPEAQQIEEARQAADRAAVLAAQQVTSQEDLDSARFVKENRHFEGNIPSQAELEACQAACEEYLALTAETQNGGLSEGELAHYEKLLRISRSGALEEDRLDRLTNTSRELLKVRHGLEELAISEEEAGQLAALEDYFAPGVPSEEEILTQRQRLAQARQLRQTAAIQAEPPKKTGTLTIPALILGVVGIVLGIVLLAGQNFLPGGIALGVGILALIGAAYLNLRQMVTGQQGRMAADAAEAAALEQAVRQFAEKYGSGESLEEDLRRIQRNRGDYLSLLARQETKLEKRSRLTRQAGQLEEVLREALGQVPDYDKAILNLRLARTQFLDLRQKKAAAEAMVQDILGRSLQCGQKLTEFFGRYYGNVTPERFSSLLSRLQRDSDAYLRARNRTADWEARKARHEQAAESCRMELSAFFAGYGLEMEDDPRSQLQQIRDDRKTFGDVSPQLEKLSREKAEYEAEHSRVLSAPQSRTQEDAEDLKAKEAQLIDAAAVLTRQLLEQRQQAQALRAQIDRIPEIRDELERWQEKRSTDQKRAQVLDDTMEFLQKAKDSLSVSYLGPIRRSFAGYMNRLAEEKGETILVTPDLEVQLERLGQARELGYFSAGQTDMVMLCMRLALVDALFKDVKPFVILDDPFVNLDDGHTAEALTLLQELAKERQIVYLVCNSSRTPPVREEP